MIEPSTTLIIPNFNGKELLAKNLPSIQKAISYSGGQHEIIVVDDGSTDNSVIFIKKNFPEVKCVRFEKNVGFAAACNKGIEECEYDIVIVLNNDVRVEKDFIVHLLPHFNKREVFAVSPNILRLDKGGKSESVHYGIFENGYLNLYNPLIRGEEFYPQNFKFLLYACGGAAAYDKQKFKILGGFDRLYAPFYWEDLDLSYRAWKRGWKVIYEPKSVVYHQHNATINKYYSNSYIDLIYKRNSILFIWKNITNKKMMRQHLWALLKSVIKSIILFDPSSLRIFTSIISRGIPAIISNYKERPLVRLSDEQILKLTSPHLIVKNKVE